MRRYRSGSSAEVGRTDGGARTGGGMGDERSKHGNRHLRVGRRRGLVVAGLVVALLAVVIPAFGDTPESGPDPNVTLTVTPDDFLGAPEQNVTVTGTGFPPNTPGVIRQCGGTAGAPQCDPDPVGSFVAGASGQLPPTAVTVVRTIDTGTTTFNCGVQMCFLVATAGTASSQHHIRFAGAGTIVPTSSSSTTTTTIAGVPDLTPLCGLLQTILAPFSFLGGLLDDVLAMLGC